MNEPDYTYPTVEDYEKILGAKTNTAFRIGWSIARTTNTMFKTVATADRKDNLPVDHPKS